MFNDGEICLTPHKSLVKRAWALLDKTIVDSFNSKLFIFYVLEESLYIKFHFKLKIMFLPYFWQILIRTILVIVLELNCHTILRYYNFYPSKLKQVLWPIFLPKNLVEPECRSLCICQFHRESIKGIINQTCFPFYTSNLS